MLPADSAAQALRCGPCCGGQHSPLFVSIRIGDLPTSPFRPQLTVPCGGRSSSLCVDTIAQWFRPGVEAKTRV